MHAPSAKNLPLLTYCSKEFPEATLMMPAANLTLPCPRILSLERSFSLYIA